MGDRRPSRTELAGVLRQARQEHNAAQDDSCMLKICKAACSFKGLRVIASTSMGITGMTLAGKASHAAFNACADLFSEECAFGIGQAASTTLSAGGTYALAGAGAVTAAYGIYKGLQCCGMFSCCGDRSRAEEPGNDYEHGLTGPPV